MLWCDATLVNFDFDLSIIAYISDLCLVKIAELNHFIIFDSWEEACDVGTENESCKVHVIYVMYLGRMRRNIPREII